jgi:hypothetical protein
MANRKKDKAPIQDISNYCTITKEQGLNFVFEELLQNYKMIEEMEKEFKKTLKD